MPNTKYRVLPKHIEKLHEDFNFFIQNYVRWAALERVKAAEAVLRRHFVEQRPWILTKFGREEARIMVDFGASAVEHELPKVVDVQDVNEPPEEVVEYRRETYYPIFAIEDEFVAECVPLWRSHSMLQFPISKEFLKPVSEGYIVTEVREDGTIVLSHDTEVKTVTVGLGEKKGFEKLSESDPNQ